MRGDFSRLVLRDAVASRVLQQQGRVLLDSDWNDAFVVLLQAQRALAADLIGPHGGPRAGTAYEVSPRSHHGLPDLGVGDGTYYVDGVRVEVHRPRDAGHLLWSEQPYPPWVDVPALPPTPYLVYLDVWERHVSAAQDDSLLEVALGGPDTTTRAEVVWQVRVARAAPELVTECRDFPLRSWRRGLIGTQPRLRAWVGRAGEDDGPGSTGPKGRYQGVEDHLYRVEITEVTDTGARFSWSRDNGSVAAAWTGLAGDRLLLEGLREPTRDFSPGDWLELTWDRLELAGRPGPRVHVVEVDAGSVTFDASTVTSPLPADPSRLSRPIARRWDSVAAPGSAGAGGALDVTEGDQAVAGVHLENGIRVQFAQPADRGATVRYRVGDYWTFPARVATGDIIWPRDASGAPLAVVPQGVEHHYAPLALVGDGGSVTDLRHVFEALATCQ